jgi:hypothetical protein
MARWLGVQAPPGVPLGGATEVYCSLVPSG